MPYLALILFTPWFAILGGLYWLFPRQPRSSMRRAFDAIALLLAAGGSFAGMDWAYHSANTDVGAMWKQILATLVAYGVFVVVMTLALLLRIPMLRKVR